jgi:hypothetical protein
MIASGQKKKPNEMEQYQREILGRKSSSKDIPMKQYKGLIVGYQNGKYDFLELGYSHGASSLDFMYLGMGSSLEWNFKDKVAGYKLGLWINSILSFGLHSVFYYNYNKDSEDFKKLSLGLRPEIGLGYSGFNIVYGYNVLFLNAGNEGVNKHMVSANLVIRISKFKDL